MEERLEIISKISGINSNSYSRKYHDTPDKQKKYNNQEKTKSSKFTVHHYDLHKTKYVDYQDEMPWEHNGIELHPTYEGKVMTYVNEKLPFLMNEKTMFWIVGSKPDKQKMYKLLNKKLGDFPTKLKQFKFLRDYNKKTIGSYCQLNKINSVSKLKKGMDFRLPQYRREVFLKLYEFHIKYKAHAGGVYFAFPYINKKYNLNQEQKLWLGFINGCTQNIVSSWLIFQQFPELKNIDIDKLNDWWNKEHTKYKVGSGWDLDRRYFKIGKTGFPNCVKSYYEQVKKYGSQEDMYANIFNTNDEYKNYENGWEHVKNNYLSFGRLSTFSYLEFLRIQGMNLNCNNLYLDDISGSRSHRNGICIVLGRDDLDWNKEKEVKYSKETISWLDDECRLLLAEAKKRIKSDDVNLFTLETTLCNYKSWHRPNRRYPNVYMDMMYQRIKYAEKVNNIKLDIFWDMRKETLPVELRIEDNRKDLGLNPIKQNHYLNTGEVIMMNNEWECFENEYNKHF